MLPLGETGKGGTWDLSILCLTIVCKSQLSEKKKFHEKESLSVAIKNIIGTNGKLECGLQMR